MDERVMELLSARSGHFLLESGHHGNLWLDLELLCLHPRRVQALAAELADRLCGFNVEGICGPLVEGAFLALMVASQLNVKFTYAERFSRPPENGLYPAGYRIPAPLREALRGRRVAIVNDVINAGSAVKGTFTDLQTCGANVVAIGSLIVLGTAAREFASARNAELISLASLVNNLWAPSDCPYCSSGDAPEDIGGFAAALATTVPKG
jgi:orotate phosphoribosyltransferase